MDNDINPNSQYADFRSVFIQETSDVHSSCSPLVLNIWRDRHFAESVLTTNIDNSAALRFSRSEGEGERSECKKRIKEVGKRKMKGLLRSCACTVTILLTMAFCTANAGAYSVLTHEELIDLAWNASIKPFLLARFPAATDDQLREAHAYAYGGSAIQDMGYYPFGKKFFSNLTHYVRTGDFIACMFRNARTMDEYAFAIGALSHYLGDTIGHSQAINPATGVEFPKLQDKFGSSVTYGESPHGHIRTEFAFDIEALTDAAFAPPAYLRFIGFKVPRKFLEQAFLDTYGFDVHEVLGRAHPALRSYGASVRRFIPAIAQAEVVLHRHQFLPRPNDEAYRIFAGRVSQTNYDRNWKHTYRGPGFRAHLLAALVFIMPKIGSAADLAIKIPNSDTEEWYLRSVNHTVDSFRAQLDKFRDEANAGNAKAAPANLNPANAHFANLDLDTGKIIKRGDYPLADKTYSQLLERLTSNPRRTVSENLRQNIVEYYAASENAPDPGQKINAQLDLLKGMRTIAVVNRNGDALVQ